jgi:hypothetical protein
VPQGSSAPLHALITGEEDERDRRVRFENAPRFGIVGKPLAMTYRVTDTGRRGQEAVDVRVSRSTASRSSVETRDRRRGDAAGDRRAGGRAQHRRTVDRPGGRAS